MKLRDVINRFSSARAEFYSASDSVFGKFVVPPYIESRDLSEIAHSVAIVGGRGCGKTTYVKYFSHWTQFDKSRAEVDKNALKCIILYWKPDTAYCRSLTKSWLSEKNARLFFQVLAGASLLRELLSAIDNISHHYPDIPTSLIEGGLFWNRLEGLAGARFSSLSEALDWTSEELYRIQAAINSDEVNGLPKLDPKGLLEILLSSLVKDCPIFRESQFKVFVDEFENLAEYQQKIINNFRKHSNAFLSWNVAHKRFAILSNSTDGDENLQQPSDYREYVLDESFSGEDDEAFFLKELLLLGLISSGLVSDIEHLSADNLGDRDKLILRKDEGYRRDVDTVVSRILPTVKNRELAGLAVESPAVLMAVRRALSGISGLSKEKIERVIAEKPDVAIASIAISSQRNFDPKDLSDYIDSGYMGKQYTQKVQTYIFASLLNLNARFSYINIPVYSGFERYCQMTLRNIRHFFDLCYNSFSLMEGDYEVGKIEDFPALSLDVMHQGAIKCSQSILKEIPTYSPKGLTLNTLSARLGGIFQILQTGNRQSEPERTHFYIQDDFGVLPGNIGEVVSQAKCWRVLIEYPATKDKNSVKSSGVEYRLNPIYSPAFGISYRKIRRIDMTQEVFHKLCFGESEAYEEIREQYIRIAETDSGQRDSSNDNQGSLF